MAEDDGKNKNENPTEPEGKQDPEPTPAPVAEPEGPSNLDRLEAGNKEKARLLEEEKILQKRKEDLFAQQMAGGHTVAAKPQEPEKDPKEKAKDYGKSIMAGKLPGKENE